MTLLLDSLLIENYRVFKRLEIPRLGRVNLLVGRNNSGKSSVLEAVRLYANRGAEAILRLILESHDLRIEGSEVDDVVLGVNQLFNGRNATATPTSDIRIGPIARNAQTLRITLVATRSGRLPIEYQIHPQEGNATRAAHVDPRGLAPDTAARLWDLIALTDFEEDVTAALRIVSPDIERISFVGESGHKRIPLAKLSSQEKPVSLRSLGDGANRLLGIALALASARGGVLLVDEVENGIHFAAQQRLWELIFRLASRLDTQVFATTHSWDCIEAFQHAAANDAHEEAVLVRLDVRADAVSPTTFSERELAIVTRERIEVR